MYCAAGAGESFAAIHAAGIMSVDAGIAGCLYDGTNMAASFERGKNNAVDEDYLGYSTSHSPPLGVGFLPFYVGFFNLEVKNGKDIRRDIKKQCPPTEHCFFHNPTQTGRKYNPPSDYPPGW